MKVATVLTNQRYIALRKYKHLGFLKTAVSIYNIKFPCFKSNNLQVLEVFLSEKSKESPAAFTSKNWHDGFGESPAIAIILWSEAEVSELTDNNKDAIVLFHLLNRKCLD